MTTTLSDSWEKALILENFTLSQAIQNLDESKLQIAIVVSSNGTLIGTLTDGDIRRGLLRDLGLQSSIAEIIYRKPLAVPPQLGRETALQIMQTNKIHQLPIVDENWRVVGLHLWDELMVSGERPNLMVLMVGGQGSRLKPHTENCPKPLLPVDGKPILERIIERAKNNGFRHFVLAVHYLGHMIEDYFGNGSRFQIQIDYLKEKSPLGTAGALSLLNPRPDAPFLVSNGDVLTDIHYGEIVDFHSRRGASATMAVRPYEWQHPFGVVRTKGVDIVGYEEKPVFHNHINAGIYVLEPRVLDVLAYGESCDMPTLIKRLQEISARTIAYPMYEPWLDIGRVDDLVRARAK